MASENKDTMAKHASWSEGILGDKAAPSAVAYSWIDRNVPVSGRTHMLLADLTAGVHARNPSLSVQQAVLAAAKDMVQKGVATSDLRTFVQQGGRFSRPGAKDMMAVEDRFYFGKGRKERFADDYAAANRRVQGSSELRKYAKIIMSDDWREGADHWRWVATAPVSEIASWAKQIADDM